MWILHVFVWMFLATGQSPIVKTDLYFQTEAACNAARVAIREQLPDFDRKEAVSMFAPGDCIAPVYGF